MRRARWAGVALALAGASALAGSAPSSAAIGGNDRVSVTTGGGELSTASQLLDLSASGQFVVFTSQAPELGVSAGTGVFVHDRLADATAEIDVVTGTTQIRAEISDDGAYVAYTSGTAIWLYDRVADTNVLLGPGASSRSLAISGDGSTVAYTHNSGEARAYGTATGATSTISTGHVQALSGDGRYLLQRVGTSFQRVDRLTSATATVAPSGTIGSSDLASLSGDGETAVWSTVTNVASLGDTDGRADLYRWAGGTTTSLTASRPDTDRAFESPSISADGRYVAHAVGEAGLYGAILTPTPQVLDLQTLEVRPAVVRPDGLPPGASSGVARLSADGRFVASTSEDDGLVPGDTNGAADVFVRDRVGPPSGSGFGSAEGTIFGPNGPVASAQVTFTGQHGTYVATTASDGSYSLSPLPADGYVVSATATGMLEGTFANAVPGAEPVLVVVEDGESVQVSFPLTLVDRGPATTLSRSTAQADAATSWAASDDAGRYVAFASAASNLVADDTNGVSDVFVVDRETDLLVRVSVSATGDQLAQGAFGPSISADGRTVAFVTAADGVVAGDADGASDAFVRDLETGASTRITATVSGTLRRPPASGTRLTALTGDALEAAYATAASADQWVRTRVDGSTASLLGRDVSFDQTGSVTMSLGAYSATGFGRPITLTGASIGCSICTPAGLSRNGQWAVYSPNGQDVVVRNLVTNQTTTHFATGRGRTSSLFSAIFSNVVMADARISNDGRHVVFTTANRNLDDLTARPSTEGSVETYAFDRATNDLRRITVRNDRTLPLGDATLVDLSADGSKAYLLGSLGRDDTNGVADLIEIDLRDDFTGASATGVVAGQVTAGGGPYANAEVLVLDGLRWVARTRTGADGRYRVAGLPLVAHRIRVLPSHDLHTARYASDGAFVSDGTLVTPTVGATTELDAQLDPVTTVPITTSASRITRVNVSTVAPAASASGRFVAYAPASGGIIVRDRALERDRYVAATSPNDLHLSADGRHLFLLTTSSLDPDDADTVADAYRIEVATAEATLISRTPAGGNVPTVADLDVSDDGKVAVFAATSAYRRNLDQAASTLIGSSSTRVAVSGDGTRYAHSSTTGTTVAGPSLPVPVVLPASSGVLSLDRDGDRVLFSSMARFVPGVRNTLLSADLYVHDTTKGSAQLVNATSGGTTVEWSLPALSGDGRSVVLLDDDGDWRRRDVDSGSLHLASTADSGNVSTLSADGNTLVFVRSNQLWVDRVSGSRLPSAPSVTLAGPVGAGAVVSWATPFEHPTDLPTEIVVRRYEDAGSTPVETATQPFVQGFGIHITPTVTPGSTQRYEVVVRNAVGDSVPGVSESISLADAATVEVLVQGPDGPVRYAAVVAYDLAGTPATFGATDETGTTTITLAAGSYRLRSFASDDTPYLDAWYGGGPLAAGGVLTVAEGDAASIQIDAGLPGTVRPVSHSPATGMLGATVVDADASADGRWVAFASSPLVAQGPGATATVAPSAVHLRDTTTGALTLPCAGSGAYDLRPQAVAVSDDGRYVAMATGVLGRNGIEPGNDIVRCDRQTGELTSLWEQVGGARNGLQGLTGSLLLSGDGTTVSFHATATGLTPTASANAGVYAWRPSDETVVRLTNATQAVTPRGITADGSRVAVITAAPLDPIDADTTSSLYLLDTDAGAAELVSRSPISAATTAIVGTVSDDGSTAAFTTTMGMTSPVATQPLAYLVDLDTGVAELVSTDGAGRPITGNVSNLSLSTDGRYLATVVVGSSTMDVQGAANDAASAFLFDTQTASVRLIDQSSSVPRQDGSGVSEIVVADDGASATFTTRDRLLPIADPTTTTADVHRWTAATMPAYGPASGDGAAPVVSLASSDLDRLTAPGETSASATWTATATDAVDGPLPITCTHEPGPFPVGSTPVHCSAVDAAGNVGVLPFSVNVATSAVVSSTGSWESDPYGTFGCAALADGTVSCWGSPHDKRTGGPETSKHGPRPVSGLTGVVEVAGTNRVCARLADGGVRCWGDGSAVPTAPAGLPSTVVDLSGSATTCVVQADGTVWCWGNNDGGLLGRGTGAGGSSATPLPVLGISTAVEVAVGRYTACARLADGTVRCWGRGDTGGMGNGTSTYTNSTPVAVPGVTGVVQLTSDTATTCARHAGGSLTCWGGNSDGTIGDGTTTRRLTPVAVPGITSATSVTVQALNTVASTCAGRSDGTLRCWGVVDGVRRTSPIAMPGVTDVARVEVASPRAGCYVSTTGFLRCPRAIGGSQTIPHQ